MAISKEAQSNNRYRENLMKKLMDFCSAADIGGSADWVRQTASNSFAFMFVNDEGGEGTVKITVSFPKGSRDGEPYDYDAEADEFIMKQENKKKRAERAAELKAKKIAADAKKREMLEKQKAKRENGE